MTAETSPARLQSCFGALCVNFGLKVLWDLCSGSSSPHSHHSEHHKLDQYTNLLHHPPLNIAVQGCLNAPHHKPFGVEECCMRPCSTAAKPTQGSHFIQQQGAWRQTLKDPQCCSENKFKLSSNSAPYRTRAEWTFEGTQLDCTDLFCSKKNNQKTPKQTKKKKLKKEPQKTKPQTNPYANLWLLNLLLHLHHSPAKTSRYVDWLYFKARDALQVLLTPTFLRAWITVHHTPLSHTQANYIIHLAAFIVHFSSGHFWTPDKYLTATCKRLLNLFQYSSFWTEN